MVNWFLVGDVFYLGLLFIWRNVADMENGMNSNFEMCLVPKRLVPLINVGSRDKNEPAENFNGHNDEAFESTQLLG